MDQDQERTSPKQELLGVYKTIFLFLKNENFPASSETFKKECESFGCQIPDVSGKVILHTIRENPRAESHSVGNQTGPTDVNVKNESFTLETSFQEGANCIENQNKERVSGNPFLPQSTSSRQKHKNQNNAKGGSLNIDPDISLKSRFNQLQEEHKKLIAVTAELTNALQLNIIGQTKNIHRVLDQCKTIYPSLFISQNNQQESASGVMINTKRDVDDSSSSEGFLSTTDYNENLPERQETAGQENLDATHEKEPNRCFLDLEPGPNENEAETQLYTPVSEKEIRDILEIILSKAISYLGESERNHETNCCDVGKACMACRNEISKIVESILVKVMESPRYKTTPRYCSSANSCAKINLVSNQCQGEVPDELPQQLRDNVMQVNDGNIIRVNDNKLQKENHSSEEPTSSLNYDTVKNDLLKFDNDEILCVLQALRWRLTKSNVDERNKTMEAYMQQDILNMHEGHFWPELLFEKNCSNVNEYFMRLLNAIASLRRGRDYLGCSDKVLKSVLLPQFMKTHVSSAPRYIDMLAATLQKLSLQRHMRIEMINKGLLDFLIGFLDENCNKLSLYSLERCTALLMNLCSMSDARKYCLNNSKKVINLLKKLLTEPHTSCLPYINGTLLSLLVHEDIRYEAQKQQLDQVIQQLIKNIKDEYLSQQLSFIMHSRFGGQLQTFIGDDNETPQNPDVLESELDTDSEEEVLLDEPAKKVYKKSDNEDNFKHQLDPSKIHNTPKFHDTSLAEVGKCEPHFRKYVKTSLSTDSSKRKKIVRRFQNFPKSSFCYMEICHGAQEGLRTCGCTNCVPGKNRYSCGCYDVICREIAEEIDNTVYKGQAINRKKYIKKTYREGSIEVIKNTSQNINGSCAICGDKICDCAFESRPKIHRTPPKT